MLMSTGEGRWSMCNEPDTETDENALQRIVQEQDGLTTVSIPNLNLGTKFHQITG